MDTLLLTAEQTDKAGEILAHGGIVAIPTETVYGLAASVYDTNAIENVFKAKGRPQDNPLIVHISSLDQLTSVAKNIPPEAYELAKRFWPGPLTMILDKQDSISDTVTAGFSTVAVRFPSHETALRIISAANVPLAAPSANLSGSPSPTEAGHVYADLNGRIDAIVDGGSCSVGVESTIVSLFERPFRLLRPGGITLEQLQSVLGEVVVDRAVTAKLSENEKVRAPGMKYRHYAPKAPVRAVKGSGRDTAEYIRSRITGKTAVICYREYADEFSNCYVYVYGDETAKDELARNLFSVLRETDAACPDIIYIQCPDDSGIGLAVANRIKKAAGFDITEL